MKKCPRCGSGMEWHLFDDVYKWYCVYCGYIGEEVWKKRKKNGDQ